MNTFSPTNVSRPRRVAVLGSSGSIGRSALEVIAESEGRLEVFLLSVHRRTDLLVDQIRQLAVRSVAERMPSTQSGGSASKTQLPQYVVITDETADRTPLEHLPPGIEVFFGYDALCEYVRRPEIDIVLSAIVGSVGLTSTWSALETGKTVALANKESLVLGGSLITELARKTGGCLLPVDSEHSAILQCLQSWNIGLHGSELGVRKAVDNEHGPQVSEASGKQVSGARLPNFDPGSPSSVIEKLILTASGGPFRTWSLEELAKVKVEDALAHPTWTMGKKITVDSATLMNKALEIIEARWFFELPAGKIDVVIHPQSIVHSMVEFIDGSTIAQLGPPDMRLPIQLALNYPNRFDGPAARIDWKNKQTLEFYAPDPDRFPAIALGLEVAETAGTSGAVVNAANEVAVAAFLDGKLPFSEIVPTCRAVLEHHHYEQRPTLQRVLELDQWARNETRKMIAG